MPRPAGDPDKMSREERDEYYAHFAAAKLYARGKAVAFVVVDEKEEAGAVRELLFKCMKSDVTFQRELFQTLLVGRLGFSRAKAKDYARRAFFEDDTYGVPPKD